MRINRVKLIAEMARQDMTVNRLTELSGVSRVTITVPQTPPPSWPRA